MLNSERINLILVHPVGRSGSVLMQSLLDGHPSIANIPYFGDIYSEFDCVINQNNSEVRKFFSNIYFKYPEIFDTRKGYFGKGNHTVAGAFGDNFDNHIITSFDLFWENILIASDKIFINHANLGQRDLFILFHLAFQLCHGGELEEIKYILYHPHDLKCMKYIIKAFPSLHLLIMTRRLDANWSSWKVVRRLRSGKLSAASDNIHLFQEICHYTRQVAILHSYEKEIKNFKKLDLMKLHNDSNSMRDIADWLGIEFNNRLIISSFCKMKWAGNAANRDASSSLQPGRADNIENLTFEELLLLECLGWRTQVYLGYKEVPDIKLSQDNYVAEIVKMKNLLKHYRDIVDLSIRHRGFLGKTYYIFLYILFMPFKLSIIRMKMFKQFEKLKEDNNQIMVN